MRSRPTHSRMIDQSETEASRCSGSGSAERRATGAAASLLRARESQGGVAGREISRALVLLFSSFLSSASKKASLVSSAAAGAAAAAGTLPLSSDSELDRDCSRRAQISSPVKNI